MRIYYYEKDNDTRICTTARDFGKLLHSEHSSLHWSGKSHGVTRKDSTVYGTIILISTCIEQGIHILQTMQRTRVLERELLASSRLFLSFQKPVLAQFHCYPYVQIVSKATCTAVFIISLVGWYTTTAAYFGKQCYCEPVDCCRGVMGKKLPTIKEGLHMQKSAWRLITPTLQVLTCYGYPFVS